MSTRLALAVLSLSCAVACQAQPPDNAPSARPNLSGTFRSADGKFETQAEMLAYASGVATLKKTDGAVVRVAMDKLDRASQRSILSHLTDYDDLLALARERWQGLPEDPFLKGEAKPATFVGKILTYDVTKDSLDMYLYGPPQWDRQALTRDEVGTIVFVLPIEKTVVWFGDAFGDAANGRRIPGVIVHRQIALLDISTNEISGRASFADKQDVVRGTAVVGEFERSVNVGAVDTAESVRAFLGQLIPAN